MCWTVGYIFVLSVVILISQLVFSMSDEIGQKFLKWILVSTFSVMESIIDSVSVWSAMNMLASLLVGLKTNARDSHIILKYELHHEPFLILTIMDKGKQIIVKI